MRQLVISTCKSRPISKGAGGWGGAVHRHRHRHCGCASLRRWKALPVRQ